MKRHAWSLTANRTIAEGVLTFQMTGSTAPALIALLAPILTRAPYRRNGAMRHV